MIDYISVNSEDDDNCNHNDNNVEHLHDAARAAPGRESLFRPQVFNLPRKDWICPTGWEGLDDTRFKSFRDLLTVTEVDVETSVQNRSGITKAGHPVYKTRQVPRDYIII